MTRTINCIVVDDEPAARDILTIHIGQIEGLHLVASCKSALEAFNILNAHHVDLVFLDIKMPQVSGLSFAKSIQKNSKVIFTTAYRDYAVEGFDLQAVDYLLKPISLERLLVAIQKFRHECVSVSVPEDRHVRKSYIFIRSNRKMVKIDFDVILYIESLSDYVKFHTINGVVITRETISNIEDMLPADLYVRIHRSFIVSLKHITSYTNEHIELDEKYLPISKSYRESVILRLG